MFSVLMHLYYIDVLNRIFLQCEFFFVNFTVFFQRQKTKSIAKNGGVYCDALFTNLEVSKN